MQYKHQTELYSELLCRNDVRPGENYKKAGLIARCSQNTEFNSGEDLETRHPVTQRPGLLCHLNTGGGIAFSLQRRPAG